MSVFTGRRVLLVAADPAEPAAPGTEHLGYGDLLRILALVPEFRAERVTWCSPAPLHALVRDCPFLDACIGPESLAEAATRHNVLLNLTFAPLPGLPDAVAIERLLDRGETLKEKTFDLPRRLADAFGLERAGVPMPVLRSQAPANRVGFNWRVPDAWKIKALPEDHWSALEGLLAPSLQISRQPSTGTMADYVEWVSSCRVLVSPVGLGCHLAMFYGAGLVMLAGPTDFLEAEDYPLGTILRPPSPCPHRPCQRPRGMADCGCMPDFRPDDIAAAVVDLLGRMEAGQNGKRQRS